MTVLLFFDLDIAQILLQEQHLKTFEYVYSASAVYFTFQVPPQEKQE